MHGETYPYELFLSELKQIIKTNKQEKKSKNRTKLGKNWEGNGSAFMATSYSLGPKSLNFFWSWAFIAKPRCISSIFRVSNIIILPNVPKDICISIMSITDSHSTLLSDTGSNLSSSLWKRNCWFTYHTAQKPTNHFNNNTNSRYSEPYAFLETKSLPVPSIQYYVLEHLDKISYSWNRPKVDCIRPWFLSSRASQTRPWMTTYQATSLYKFD